MAVAEADRLLDQTRAIAAAQLPGAEPDDRNLEALGLDHVHRDVRPLHLRFSTSCKATRANLPDPVLRPVLALMHFCTAAESLVLGLSLCASVGDAASSTTTKAAPAHITYHGVAYLKHFMGPMWWLAIIMVPIEIISHLARMLSLTVRLYANMFAGDMVTMVFFSLVPIGVPIIFLGLHIGVSLLQTYIFVLLTMVYLSGAVAEEH